MSISQQAHQITQHLNPPQKKAVENVDGPMLVLAGAGSGKTRVLTHRMAYMVATGKARPDEVLAVTFTNKAAKEMESRIFGLLTDLNILVREPLWISTFHSICNRILKSHITLLDYQPYFVIYDDSDQLSQIKKIMTALNIDEKKISPKALRSQINTAKMWGLDPDQTEKDVDLSYDKRTIEIYRLYEQEMKKANALDFGDLLLKVYELFRMYPDILEKYQDQFKYIMVDEYQDTNHIQYLLVKMLASKTRNLCVVGDEDQSIYSWRGADIQNILGFEEDFPEAIVIKLEENYRSTATIVKGASSVIRNNLERKNKTLFSNAEDGDLITVREERNEYDEARYVVTQIQKMMNEGDGNYSDYAVFYRTNAQSRVLEEQLRSSGVPYKIVGGVRFYERMEIKDILGYLKLSLNPSDDMAFKRIINVPARGIGKVTVEKIEDLSFKEKISMLEACKKAIEQRVFNAGTTSKLRNFILLMEDLHQQSQELPLLDFFQVVLERSEYLLKLRTEDTMESRARIENLEELGNALAQFSKERTEATLQAFLEEMALVSDVDSLDDEVNSVTLMTIHISKGLEFPQVFIVGLEENLFPSGMSAEEEADGSVEEERRLAYVGMTRARKKLFLTHARTRKVWGQEQFNPPSRFLKEIDPSLVQKSSAIAAPNFVSRAAQTYKKTPRDFESEFENQSFPDYENSTDFQKGMRVRHPTFGVGSIFQTEGSGEEQKISVMFADQTVKKFVAKYARLERV